MLMMRAIIVHKRVKFTHLAPMFSWARMHCKEPHKAGETTYIPWCLLWSISWTRMLHGLIATWLELIDTRWFAAPNMIGALSNCVAAKLRSLYQYLTILISWNMTISRTTRRSNGCLLALSSISEVFQVTRTLTGPKIHCSWLIGAMAKILR